MRRLAAVALTTVAASVAAAPAFAAPVTAPEQAPSTVLIVAPVGFCSGTLIDASHVLTSADCVVDAKGSPLPAGAFGVLAGTIASGLLGPDAQHSVTIGVRIHPAYLATGGWDAAVAMLELATPLTTTAAVAPVPVVPSGTPLSMGLAATSVGWGRTGGADPIAQTERTWDLTTLKARCLIGMAGYACGTPTADAGCDVFPGGPVLAPHDPTLLIGVVVDNELASCGDERDHATFVDLATPGIAQWVLGDDTPDPMPFTRGRAMLTAQPRRGGTISCTPPVWTNAGQVHVDFTEDNDHLEGSRTCRWWSQREPRPPAQRIGG